MRILVRFAFYGTPSCLDGDTKSCADCFNLGLRESGYRTKYPYVADVGSVVCSPGVSCLEASAPLGALWPMDSSNPISVQIQAPASGGGGVSCPAGYKPETTVTRRLKFKVSASANTDKFTMFVGQGESAQRVAHNTFVEVGAGPRVWLARTDVFDGLSRNYWLVADADQTTVCVPDEVCGDRVVVGSEECDDGNLFGGDGCTRDCRREPVCGDGICDPIETGPEGYTDCAADCPIVCGPTTYKCGTAAGKQRCCWEDMSCHIYDDPSAEPGTTNYMEPRCEYSVQWNECDECEFPSPTSPVRCYLMPSCTTVQCRDKSDPATDCTPTLSSVCGNRFKEPYEQCEDGNLENGDGCDASCQWE